MARKRKDKKKQQPQKKKITAESNKNKELRDKILKNKADTFKIVTLGDGTVGKTTLRTRFMGQGFQKLYNMTIGADFSVKRVSHQGDTYVAQIWDIAGQLRFEAIRSMYLKNTDGAMLIFDLTRPKSFESIPRWIEELTSNNEDRIMPMVLIGNKSDKVPDTKDYISYKVANNYAKELSDWANFTVPYIETSAKGGNNVDMAFKEMVKSINEYNILHY